MDNQSISQLDTKRKQAQDAYIITLADARGLTTEQLEARITNDLCHGVPNLEIANILCNMRDAAQRVNGNGRIR